jgi:hypothetical protein
MFFPRRPLQPIANCASKAGAILVRVITLPTNVTLGLKDLLGTNIIPFGRYVSYEEQKFYDLGPLTVLATLHFLCNLRTSQIS